MMWKREYGPSYYNSYDFLLSILIILTIIGLFVGQSVIFTIIGLYATYFIVYTVFDKRVTKNIALKNPKQVIRLFPEEEDVLRFELENKSIYPAINGQFTFQTDSSIHAKHFSKLINEHWRRYEVSASLVRKGKTSIELPIYAEKRGTARIRNISYTFPHLFNFDKVGLNFILFFNTEVIVYPTLKYVKGIESIFEMTPGAQPIHYSPFEDVQNRIGTRNYHLNDSFKRINWKASAKTQKLQTNMYEKVIDISYVFLVNIGTRLGTQNMAQLNKNLENILSYTAYLCKYASKKGFPFEMFINARKPGKVPFLHLEEGEGQTHFAGALEMLARIPRQSMVVPFDHMLHRVGKKLTKPQSIVIIGDVHPKTSQVMDTWTRTHPNIFHLDAFNEQGAILKPWENGLLEYMK